MERFTFFLASAAFCLLLTVTLTSAMTTDCLCDTLPGDQCSSCTHTQQQTWADQHKGSLGSQYKQALRDEDRQFHQQWVERNRAFHTIPHTPAEEVQFATEMQASINHFHEMLGITDSGSAL